VRESQALVFLRLAVLAHKDDTAIEFSEDEFEDYVERYCQHALKALTEVDRNELEKEIYVTLVKHYLLRRPECLHKVWETIKMKFYFQSGKTFLD